MSSAEVPLLDPDAGLDHATVVLTNGDFPRHPLTRTTLRNARRLVCCDGAAAALARHCPDLAPDAIVGDFDSLSPAVRRRYPADRFHAVAEQETNDLAKSLRFCRARRWKAPVVLGASGKREDHFLGNVALLADAADDFPGIRMLTDHGLFLVVRGPARIRCGAGRAVSLFSFDPAQRLTASGLRYPLDDLPLAPFWRATLNTATAETIALEPALPAPILVYLAHRA